MTRNAFIKTVSDEALGRARSSFAVTKNIEKANATAVSYVIDELSQMCPDVDLSLLPGLIFPIGTGNVLSRNWLSHAIGVIYDKSEISAKENPGPTPDCC